MCSLICLVMCVVILFYVAAFSTETTAWLPGLAAAPLAPWQSQPSFDVVILNVYCSFEYCNTSVYIQFECCNTSIYIYVKSKALSFAVAFAAGWLTTGRVPDFSPRCVYIYIYIYIHILRRTHFNRCLQSFP